MGSSQNKKSWVVAGIAAVLLVVALAVAVSWKSKKAGKESFSTNVTDIGNTLANGKTMRKNHALRSTNGRYRAVMQDDGKFLIFDTGVTPRKQIWSMNVTNRADSKVMMQTDNNFVLYGPLGTALWASATNGKGSGAASLVMEDTGALVVYDSSKKVLWSSVGA